MEPHRSERRRTLNPWDHGDLHLNLTLLGMHSQTWRRLDPRFVSLSSHSARCVPDFLGFPCMGLPRASLDFLESRRCSPDSFLSLSPSLWLVDLVYCLVFLFYMGSWVRGLSVQKTRLALNSQRLACICLPHARIKCVPPWLAIYMLSN